MLAGALGAVTGDSALYWIARSSREKIQPQLEKAKSNDKVAAALGFMGSSAPLLLVTGRYVPGLRFVVNATLGLSAYPYRRFVLWSAIGGTLWSSLYLRSRLPDRHRALRIPARVGRDLQCDHHDRDRGDLPRRRRRRARVDASRPVIEAGAGGGSGS